MTDGPRADRASLAGVITAIALLLLGCGQREPKGERVAGEASDSSRAAAPYENPAETPHPCPPQPSGPQIGLTDPRVNAASPQLAEWAAMWRETMDGFSLDSLWLVSRSRWSPVGGTRLPPMAEREEADSESYLARALLSLHSPDQRFTLSVDSYQAVSPAGDSLIVGGERDSRCSLIDRRDSTELVLQMSGTGAGYHWGCWLSSASFAVGGWSDADDFGQWKQGGLWLYSMRDSTVSEYQTRIISADRYRIYEAAWHRWLLKRYRAWMRSHSAT